MEFEYLKETTMYLLEGANVTLTVYIVTLLFAIPLGIICAIGKLSRFKILQGLLWVYTWVFRGTPLILQLFFVYFGLPILTKDTFLDGYLTLEPMTAACITFVINYAAYFTEIFRAGIQSINKGQYEAAKALGMTPWTTMKRIIFPQAMKVIIPPLGNEGVTLIKDTALCSVIALPEILKNANRVVSRDFDVTGYLIAAAIYLVFTFVIIQIFKKIENRYSHY